MADRGFLVKINGKELWRCHSVAFDYDEWQCTVNGKEKHDLPEDVSAISVIVEES